MMHLQAKWFNGGINENVKTVDAVLRKGIWYIFKKKKDPLAPWGYLDACLFY